MRLIRGSGAEREVTVTVNRSAPHGRLLGDLGRDPLIDVSAQEDDGNPAHSNRSVVRGPLPADPVPPKRAGTRRQRLPL